MAQRVKDHKLGDAECFTDYKRMLKQVKPDVVNICTPNGLHAPAAIAASGAGCHVVVEKPMAMNAKEARDMIVAARKARRKLVIGFQFRFDPRTQFIKRALDDGALGKVLYGRVQALRRRGIPNWGVFGRKDLQGGGPLIDIGVHVLEMCHYAMGSPRPVAAMGQTFTYLGNKPSNRIASQWAGWDHKSYTVEDLAVGHIRFDNGAVIHIESSFAAHHQHEGLMDFQLMGEKGGATWSDGKVYTDQLGHMVNIEPAWIGPTGFADMFDAKTQRYLDYFLGRGDNLAPAEHGLMVQQMLDAIYASADRGGKEVAIRAD
jgi:predicted dehydrogenase